ncbi:ATP-dependent Clp protease ATP-binding subunit ClpX [Mycobacterium basiliense]|uniref:ATP-dependent Clp protease ATP-binding subunit ClpX n=2 Tax=Mycobacterium basiliense TaxID=2094119 RepID=A0A3S4FNZ4_9MYCO|nr:ATP-dependent Clp protease ATP-binding subunit ClpX [Mycobacterium basiliense]
MSSRAKPAAQIWCSFCGKSNTEVDQLVAGPGVQICNDCVGIADAIMRKYRGKTRELRLPMWGSMTDQQMLSHIPRIAVVSKQVETDLRSWVQELRRREVTWSRIGEALGMTRQSAWERFSAEA